MTGLPDGAVVGVTYHYVRPVGPRGIFPLGPDEFEAQLDALSRLGDIVPASQIDEPASGRPRFVLTFDDGSRDQYEHAFPILRRRGLSALFAVISAPHTEGWIPTFHFVHALTSAMEDAELTAALEGRFGALPDVPPSIYRFEKDEGRRRLKYALNYAFEPGAVRSLLEALFEPRIGSPQDFVRRSYLGPDEIREMAADGMEFCVHAHRHTPLAGSPEAFYEAEIAPCERWLDSILPGRVPAWIPAFGARNAASDALERTGALLAGRGYRHIWTTEEGWNDGPALFLRRMDCALLPPRRAVPW